MDDGQASMGPKMAAGGSAGFGGADYGWGGIRWSFVGLTMAGGDSVGFVAADDGRGVFGGILWG